MIEIKKIVVSIAYPEPLYEEKLATLTKKLMIDLRKTAPENGFEVGTWWHSNEENAICVELKTTDTYAGNHKLVAWLNRTRTKHYGK